MKSEILLGLAYQAIAAGRAATVADAVTAVNADLVLIAPPAPAADAVVGRNLERRVPSRGDKIGALVEVKHLGDGTTVETVLEPEADRAAVAPVEVAP